MTLGNRLFGCRGIEVGKRARGRQDELNKGDGGGREGLASCGRQMMVFGGEEGARQERGRGLNEQRERNEGRRDEERREGREEGEAK